MSLAAYISDLLLCRAISPDILRTKTKPTFFTGSSLSSLPPGKKKKKKKTHLVSLIHKQ